jgi:8-hydroxy-5-deazaflavin:NADPH oxidoreductase
MAMKETSTKKTIALLGAKGRLGAGIAPALVRAGYRVLLADDGEKDPTPVVEKLSSLVAKLRGKSPKLDIGIVSSSREASWEADVVLFAVPYETQAEVALEIREVVTGKVVVSTTNPINNTCDGLLTPSAASSAEELAQLLPHSKVVKAFSTVFPTHIERPAIAGKIVDVFVAGDDEDAVSTVMQLVKDAGFNPLFVGALSMSRTLESMMVLLLSLSARNHFLGPVGWKVVHEPPNRADHEYLDVVVNSTKIKSNHR